MDDHEVSRPRRFDVVEVAKLVRKALKRNFPGVEFRVRSNRYAGGASIYVKWFEGPERGEVEEVTRRYQGAGLDPDPMWEGLIHHSSLIADSAGSLEEVCYGADLILCFRETEADRRALQEFLEGVPRREKPEGASRPLDPDDLPF